MKPIEQYVADQLHTLVNDFPNIEAKWRINSFDGAFCVEIMPVRDFEEDINLIYRRIDILNNVLKLYPAEIIVFFTAGCTIGMEEADYTITGKDFRGQSAAKAKPVRRSNQKVKRLDQLSNYSGRSV